MKDIFFVQPEQAETARLMEKKLIELPEDSGVLFVSVTVLPDPFSQRNLPIYKVVIGCSRERENDLMHALAKRYLRDLVTDELQILVESYRGVSRNA